MVVRRSPLRAVRTNLRTTRVSTGRFSTGADTRALPLAGRVVAARACAVAGVAAYNWWIVTPWLPGVTASANAFFSDATSGNQPFAGALRRLDLSAGALIVAALLLRGARGRDGQPRREWPWLIGFAVAGGVGGVFPYACAPELDATCRHLERNLALPLHHYLHMGAGVGEFVCGGMAIGLAHLCTTGVTAPEARIARLLTRLLVVVLPLLCIAYLTRHWGGLLEPVCFGAFSIMVIVEVFTPEADQPRV